MDCSTPGLPVHHQLLEFTQTHVHWVSDAIQPSHPLSSPSPPAFNLSQHQGLFQWVSSLHQVAKYWSFNISPSNSYSGMISFRMDWLYLLAVQGTLKNLLSLQLIKINEKKKERKKKKNLLQHHSWKASKKFGKRVQFSKHGILCQMLQGLCFLCPHVNYRNKISYFFFCSFSFPQVQDRKTILQSFYEDWIWSQI